MEVGFKKNKLSICLLRIDRLDYAFSPRAPVLERGAERAGELIIRVEIPNIAEAAMAVAGTACVSKRLGLECAPAGIPPAKIVR